MNETKKYDALTSTTTFDITALSDTQHKGLSLDLQLIRQSEFMILSINGTQYKLHSAWQHCIEYHYAECRVLFIVLLNVVMLSVIMLNVILLSFIALSVIMLNAVMLRVMVP
jgi:hypothetical protein